MCLFSLASNEVYHRLSHLNNAANTSKINICGVQIVDDRFAVVECCAQGEYKRTFKVIRLDNEMIIA